MQTTLIVEQTAPAADPLPPAPTVPDRIRDGSARPPRRASGGPPGSRELWVEPWVDLSSEIRPGHHPRSPYVELFWLGVLGPSATWLIRRLAMRLEDAPEGFSVNTLEVAGEIGLGSRQALQTAFDRAFEAVLPVRAHSARPPQHPVRAYPHAGPDLPHGRTAPAPPARRP